ncbi:polyphosphoinositide phosphatase [Lodderomyces elongisporus NRRL YB-4239]|uniref:Polyphosphoinositide phosphatase n=1 Tax=Lodderomyces elongisporus (strain ATCC 11503 / CBS 2605 / JCM 1781 / NBRC 1676 / NRRL YB-4239) TaxID=379508 RepID=A5E5R5_LODEL|nr:polyphosphoinositide phosphatase [Lodderomyces elongisporus NRRL YB-4239]
MTNTSNAPLSTALSIKQYDLKPNHLLPAENVNGKERKFAQDDYDSQDGDISIISDGENVANNKVGVNHNIEDGGDNTIENQDSKSDGENIDGVSIDSNDGNGSNKVHNTEETPDSKRILLQRFTIYNSASTMYIVGSNAKESLYRVMEISTDPEDETNLTIVEDKSYFYTRKDLIELLNGLNESIEGGIHKLAHGYGLLGLIRFTKGYYMCLITKCSQVAILGGHFIYHIDETKLIPLGSYRKPEKYSDEERLLSIFRYMDLSKTFYFSYNYDITNSLQTNLMRQKLAGKANVANKLDKTKNKKKRYKLQL